MGTPNNILVTGANGQLGLCLKDISFTYPNLNFHFKNSTELDITNENNLKKLFSRINFDYCINCAAYTNVDKAETEKERAYLVNAEAVKLLAQTCKNHNTTLIHISTDFVFDGSKNSPYTEMDMPNPINVYGASKLKGEQHIKDTFDKYFILRTSWVYSAYGNNFVKTMIRLGLERDEISVVNDQIGSPTFAVDLAKVILQIISLKSHNYGTYHFSNEGTISWYGFALEIFRKKNISATIIPISSKEFHSIAKRPKHSTLDTTKIKLNFHLDIPIWSESLRTVLN